MVSEVRPAVTLIAAFPAVPDKKYIGKLLKIREFLKDEVDAYVNLVITLGAREPILYVNDVVIDLRQDVNSILEGVIKALSEDGLSPIVKLERVAVGTKTG